MHLIADRLQKKFGATTAVADVSFAAAPGKSWAFCGPNGAGKSTTISMLAGLIEPDRGSVHIDDNAWGRVPTRPSGRLGLVTLRRSP